MPALAPFELDELDTPEEQIQEEGLDFFQQLDIGIIPGYLNSLIKEANQHLREDLLKEYSLPWVFENKDNED